jgi:hypothetical protein
MSTTARAESWPRVTRRDPCPICDHHDWCSVSPDGALAACNRVQEGSYRTIQTPLGERYLHRLRDDRPPAPPPPKPIPRHSDDFDPLAARAVYALVADACRALPAEALADLVRRFGPVYGPQAAEVFGIGYCDGPALVAALEAAGRRQDAIRSGVLRANGREVARALAGRLVIPYRRGGAVWDLRGSGVKGSEGGTKEMSLPGGYAARGVDGLLFNHDALDRLQPGDDLHLAGGAYKTIALHLAGLVVVGTRGESELSDSQLAAIAAARPGRIIVHIDSEDPKPGHDLSMARQLVLPKGDRLATIAPVLIAEPPREQGGPKVDPDALLRDHGAGMVRAYAASALPLEAFKVAIGVESVGLSPEVAARIAALERKVQELETLPSVLADFERSKGIPKAAKPVAKAVTFVYNQLKSHGKVDADGWAETSRPAIAEVCGGSEDAAGDQLTRLATMGVGIHKRVEDRAVRRVDEDGQVVVERRKVLLVKVDHNVVDELRLLSAYTPPAPEGDERAKTWGGKRTPCPTCGGTKRRKVVSCADCGHEFSNTVTDNEPESIPPTPITPPSPPASYPPGSITYERAGDDEADDWLPYMCNHPGCTRYSLPDKRYCDWHSPERQARFTQRERQEPPPDVSTRPVSETVLPCITPDEIRPIDWGAVPLATSTGLGADCHICGAGMYAREGRPLLCRDCNDARHLAELEAVGYADAAGGG